jgi:DNA-binding NarL/FixJ family response regulator
MIRVLVVDDEHLVRTGVRRILATDDGISVVGEAQDGSEAARAARELRADLVLMDVQMPGTDGVDGTRLVLRARPAARVVMLTMFDLDEHVLGALRAGASGFLLKSTRPERLLAAVHGVHGGEQLFSPTILRRLVETYVERAPHPAVPPALESLTPREFEVFTHVARGSSNAEIAAALFLSEATVKTHVARILARLGLRDRIQAVILAYESGLLTARGTRRTTEHPPIDGSR